MRSRPLPKSPAVLESYLKAATHWLEAVGPLHAAMMASICLDDAPHLVARRDRGLIEEFLRENPLDGGFWDHVDWPFAWDQFSRPEKSERSFLRSFTASVDRFGFLASPTQVTVSTVQAFVRDVRDKLEEAARRPASRPEPTRAAVDGTAGDERPSLELLGRDHPPMIRGKPRDRLLEKKQYEVLKVLLDRFPVRVSLSNLKSWSGVGGARDVLRGLRGKPPWDSVIDMAVEKGTGRGNGYSIKPWHPSPDSPTKVPLKSH